MSHSARKSVFGVLQHADTNLLVCPYNLIEAIKCRSVNSEGSIEGDSKNSGQTSQVYILISAYASSML